MFLFVVLKQANAVLLLIVYNVVHGSVLDDLIAKFNKIQSINLLTYVPNVLA